MRRSASTGAFSNPRRGRGVPGLRPVLGIVHREPVGDASEQVVGGRVIQPRDWNHYHQEVHPCGIVVANVHPVVCGRRIALFGGYGRARKVENVLILAVQLPCGDSGQCGTTVNQDHLSGRHPPTNIRAVHQRPCEVQVVSQGPGRNDPDLALRNPRARVLPSWDDIF
jgi:hypothetical protein